VRLEETFWSFETFLTDFNYTPVRESEILDEDSGFFRQLVIEFKVVRDEA
jgi:hypothetical protein